VIALPLIITYVSLFLSASGRNPDIDNIVLAFQASAPFELGPYFEGYCGEHVSQYPGIEQKAGLFRPSGKFLISLQIMIRN